MKESIIERNKRIGADEKRAAFIAKQKLPYEIKKKYAAIRAREFVGLCDQHGKNYHVSVGGLDSITLFLFLHSIGIRCPGVSVSYLEDKGNQAVHRALGIVSVSPLKRADGKPWTKSAVIQEFGFPVISKEIAGKIEILQNPSEKNVTVRHAIITGETGAYGGNRKNSRMQLSQKWLRKFGGYENEREGVNYQKPDITRDKIRELMGEDCSCIELFARNKTPGWDVWGNEVNKYECVH